MALLVMGLASPLVGRMIERHGGRSVIREDRASVSMFAANTANLV